MKCNVGGADKTIRYVIGLVAASYLAGAGLSVLLLERNDYIGGA